MEINGIQEAISMKLHQAFGFGYKKYIDEVPQGFITPAFLIQFLNLEHIRQIGNRWKVTTLFNVQYFPQNGSSEASNMTLKTQQALKQIALLNGSQMLGTGSNSELVDGIAHNFIHFNFFLQEFEEKTFMESLSHGAKLKG
ncbi:phage tail terminator family protein [Psychrobacillus sp. FSL K6-1267]|uniref:phage tail terminator family protein n=1 Tax=Psychrobacillus sp. FSL K6-1267 TaxID=2921543 RepID=UPI0030F82384